MSEMAVLVIRVRKAQALEYERLFESNELPRWRDYPSTALSIGYRSRDDAPHGAELRLIDVRRFHAHRQRANSHTEVAGHPSL